MASSESIRIVIEAQITSGPAAASPYGPPGAAFGHPTSHPGYRSVSQNNVPGVYSLYAPALHPHTLPFMTPLPSHSTPIPSPTVPESSSSLATSRAFPAGGVQGFDSSAMGHTADFSQGLHTSLPFPPMTAPVNPSFPPPAISGHRRTQGASGETGSAVPSPSLNIPISSVPSPIPLSPQVTSSGQLDMATVPGFISSVKSHQQIIHALVEARKADHATMTSQDVRIAALEAKLEQTAQLNMMETEKGDSKHIATSDYPLARVS